MAASRLNYVVVHQGQSQVYGSATKDVALQTPLPDGAKIEDRMVLFIAYQPDTDHLSVHRLPDEEVRNAAVYKSKRDGSRLVANDDPENSHVAAQRVEPNVGTRRAEVLEYLRQKRTSDSFMGIDPVECGWVDGPELANEKVGGSEGLKRLRELRADGHPIEERPNPISNTAWQYRLVLGVE